jgi:branched-chain amino acid transport system ATP-binding protein
VADTISGRLGDEQPHQGDYVPDYRPGPVAAGGAGTAEVGSPDYERLRHLVPTERQLRAGADDVDVAELEAAFRAPSAQEPMPRLSRGQKVKGYLNALNPWAIEGPKIVLLAFGLQALIGGWDDQVLAVAAPEITASFGVSLVTLLWVAPFLQTFQLVMGLPLGYLVDRVKRIWLVRIGALAHQLGVLAQVFAPSFGLFTVAKAGGQAMSNVENLAHLPLTADYFPSRSRARVTGYLGLMGMIGTAIALPVIGLLIKLYGWRASVVVLAIPSFIVLVTVFFMREPVRGAMDRMEMGVSPENAAIEQKPPSFAEALRGAWQIRTLRLNILSGFVGGFAAPMTLALSYVSANEYSLDPFQRSLIQWLGVVVMIPLLFVSTNLAQRFLLQSPSRVMVMAAVMGMATLPVPFIVLLHPPLWLYAITPMLAMVPQMLVIPAVGVINLQAIPARFRGVGLQVQAPFLLIANWLAPVLAQQGLKMGLSASIIVFAPFSLIAALLHLGAATSVTRDIRAARAAALAEQESAQARAERQNKVLVCRDLDALIDDVQILSHVDLDIREGEIVALVGTNGAGKSTLLRTICGLQPASNGAIFFDGVDTTFKPTHEAAREGIVYMPGGQGVFPLMSVKDNLTSAAWMNRKHPAEVEARIEQVLEMFPVLRERIDALAGAMSGGEQQMLAVGQAFLMEPKLLMIDELSLGLAPAIVEQLLNTLREMRQRGVTVVLVEQSLNVALTVADRAVFMEKGEVKFDGPVEELLARPDLVRSVFMGGAAGGGGVTSGRKRSASQLEEAETLLRCEDVSVSFGGVNALTGVSLEVAAGEVVGIIGPNGAGKTTLFDILSGYLQPDSGAVYLGDRDVSKFSPDARARLGLGRAFQNARLFPPLTVRENIAVALERRAMKSPLLAAFGAPQVRRSERKLQNRADGFIEMLGLSAYADKFVRELSTGTRRAVEVACQMAAEPKMLLLDEPSSGLAQAEAEALGPALARIVRETGCGMLIIEHDLNLITRVSDRLIAMELGRVVTTGTPEQVIHDPEVLRSYLAASSDVIDRSGSRVASVLATVAEDLPSAPSTDPASPDTPSRS